MKLRGSLLVLFCCLLVEFCNINRIEYLLFATDLLRRILCLTGLGLLFLLYPLMGHLKDVYLTRYRSLKWSFGFLILAASIIIAYKVFDLASKWKYYTVHDGGANAVLIVLFIVYTIGLQANAIQFGYWRLLHQN